MSTGHEEHDRRLRLDLDRLQDEVYNLTRHKLPALREEVEEVRASFQDLYGRGEDAETKLRGHDDSLEELSRALRELTTIVLWTERYIRNSGTVEVADFSV